ncbi:hypothetical protein AYO41_02530 [Verrucomicrobia bacterium SCGC AG-212-E04]|nr:hypothetical protein AYO41_02530 [Verrucomicrobia bacterium SCGC AG-212-E04]
MLILNNDRAEIEAFTREGVAAFLNENSVVPPLCVALYSSPINGWISLCVDTSDHGTAPRTNCPDFSHVEFRLLERPAWSSEYESAHPTVQRHDLVVAKLSPSDGDEAYNEAFFLLLMKMSNDYYHHESGVYRPKWAGVQILDSRYSSFWRVHDPSVKA